MRGVDLGAVCLHHSHIPLDVNLFRLKHIYIGEVRL